ncbi:MAG: amidohydrolase, partial [Planctomycetota bacterium]|nr:amidohydrolase [Planctomycetota bacterium]
MSFRYRLFIVVPALLSLAFLLAGPGMDPVLALTQETGGQEAEADQDEEGPPLPIEEARRLSYTADEVSWMSVDVSPDGETIVFDLLGDLYTMPMSGGSATRLTEGMAFDGQPRFSPDGSEVVFTSDSNGGENL